MIISTFFVVPCSSEGKSVECTSSTRCLVQNVTKELSCVPSCFRNNGGCDREDVCVNYISSSDCNYPTSMCPSDVRCMKLNGD